MFLFLCSSFIITVQPSVPECVAATKYEKIGKTNSAKLSARIVCLLEPEFINKNLTFAEVGKNIND